MSYGELRRSTVDAQKDVESLDDEAFQKAKSVGAQTAGGVTTELTKSEKWMRRLTRVMTHIALSMSGVTLMRATQSFFRQAKLGIH